MTYFGFITLEGGGGGGEHYVKSIYYFDIIVNLQKLCEKL